MEEPSQFHRSAAEAIGPLAIAIVTVSDSRVPETDISGSYLRNAVESAGHLVVGYRIIPDEPGQIAATLEELTAGEARIVVFNGGTGLSRRDRTFDVLSTLYHKSIPGFGELFRALSFQEVGPAAMLSRASAGIFRDRAVFSLPGSPKAVRLAWEQLIQPELKHLVRELER